MDWLKKHWRLAGVHTVALSIVIYTFTQGTPTNVNNFMTDGFDPGLASGKWAIRFLLLCLAVTPANTYFRWRWAIPLRKWLGLWAFGFAMLHLAVYILTDAGLKWLKLSMPLYLVLGLVGLLILSALALTSNQRAMRSLKKNWKRLHRLVYAAGSMLVVHALLSTRMSKKVLARDPNATPELIIYLVLLILLLALRLPAVKSLLKPPIRWRRLKPSPQ